MATQIGAEQVPRDAVSAPTGGKIDKAKMYIAAITLVGGGAIAALIGSIGSSGETGAVPEASGSAATGQENSGGSSGAATGVELGEDSDGNPTAAVSETAENIESHPIYITSNDVTTILEQWSENFKYGINNESSEHVLIGYNNLSSTEAQWAERLYRHIVSANTLNGPREYTVAFSTTSETTIPTLDDNTTEFDIVLAFDYPEDIHDELLIGEVPPMPTDTDLVRAYFTKRDISGADTDVISAWTLDSLFLIEKDI